jgi:hypothetical protein
MKTDKKPFWNLIGEIFEDIHRIGAGLAVVGLRWRRRSLKALKFN